MAAKSAIAWRARSALREWLVLLLRLIRSWGHPVVVRCSVQTNCAGVVARSATGPGDHCTSKVCTPALLPVPGPSPLNPVKDEVGLLLFLSLVGSAFGSHPFSQLNCALGVSRSIEPVEGWITHQLLWRNLKKWHL